jgi:hypothetical protein
LDGKNRYRGCLKAGVQPRYQTYIGDDPKGFVISLNNKRRHSDVGQRAMVAEAVSSFGWGGSRKGQETKSSLEKGRDAGVKGQETKSSLEDRKTQSRAALEFGVGIGAVKQAKKVRERALPVFAEAVMRGRMNINQAAKIADLTPDEQRAEAERRKWQLAGGRRSIDEKPLKWKPPPGPRSVNPAKLVYEAVKAWFHTHASKEDKIKLAIDDVAPFLAEYEREMGA